MLSIHPSAVARCSLAALIAWACLFATACQTRPEGAEAEGPRDGGAGQTKPEDEADRPGDGRPDTPDDPLTKPVERALFLAINEKGHVLIPGRAGALGPAELKQYLGEVKSAWKREARIKKEEKPKEDLGEAPIDWALPSEKKARSTPRPGRPAEVVLAVRSENGRDLQLALSAGGEEAPLPLLDAHRDLKEHARKWKENLPALVLMCDDDVRIALVVQAMDLCREAGFREVRFRANGPPGKGEKGLKAAARKEWCPILVHLRPSSESRFKHLMSVMFLCKEVGFGNLKIRPMPKKK